MIQDSPHNNLNIRKDYYPYGMVMPNKHGSDNQYRYGFNGMEEDPEIKGSKNSYNFGARLYDPRVGRWLTLDPVAAEKADLSPYQAFRANPLVYIDPDGKDEWQVIRVVDEEGNQLGRVAYKTSSTALISTGYTTINGWFTVAHMSFGHDFKRVLTLTVSDDYQVISGTSEIMVMDYTGVKDTRSDCWSCFSGSPKKDGTIYNPGFEQPGGIYLTGKNGQGTKYYASGSTKYGGNIDLFMDLMAMTTANYNSRKEFTEDYLKGVMVNESMNALFGKNGIIAKGKFEGEFNVNDMADALIQSAKNSNSQIGLLPEKPLYIQSANEEANEYVVGTYDNGGRSGAMTAVHRGVLTKEEVMDRYPSAFTNTENINTPKQPIMHGQ